VCPNVSCHCSQLTRVRLEQDIQVCRSEWEERSVGKKAIADTVVVMGIPAEQLENVQEVIRRLYWTTNTEVSNSLIIFLGLMNLNSWMSWTWRSLSRGVLVKQIMR
jgi:hypothetical protein